MSADARVLEGALTFIGNATTLLRYGGFTILTDPNFLRRGPFALHVKLRRGRRPRHVGDA